MLAEPQAPPEFHAHYSFEHPAPTPKGPLPQYLKHLPVGASCWIEHKHLRGFRVHAKRAGWKITYRKASDVDGFVAEKLGEECGRVWRIK